jgi:hypothetical protein
MNEATNLQERRDEIKRQLTANEYATLVDVIVLKTDRLLQRIARKSKQLSFWYSALVIFLIIILTGLVISVLLNEFNSRPIIVMIIGMGLIYIGLIIFKIHHDNFNAQLQEHVVDAIESSRDLDDLQQWLYLTANTKTALLFSCAVTVLGCFFLWFAYGTAMGEFIGFGPLVAFMLSFILYGAMVYYAILFSILPNRLSRYQFKLYEPDPSSSALIHHLSTAFMNGLYLFAFYAALITLLTAMEGLFVSINMFRLIGWWAILTTLFVIIQFALSRIITTAKYKTLGEVEAQMEQIQANATFNEKDARETINWLMDYHDRIKSTPNSALRFRAILEFVNSLILPLLAFVLTHLKEIVSLFR